MTRSEAIATINRTLATLDDERIEAVAELIKTFAGNDEPYPLRELTPRELALIEQSKADFAAGRTRTLEESEAFVAAEVERRLAARSRS